MTALDTFCQRTVEMYVAGSKVSEIAAELGVSQRSVYRRLNAPGAQEVVQRVKDEVVTGLLARYLEGSETAATFVMDVLNNPEAPLGMRFQAARMIHDATFRLLGQHDLVVRMQRLEAAMRPIDTAPGIG